MKTNGAGHHDGARHSDDILREIAATRGDMDQTLKAIEDRLTPGQLLDQGLEYARNSGANEFAHNLGSSVKSNPIPVALVGIGLAWLMASGRHSSPDSSSGTGAGSRVVEAKDRFSDAARGARDRAGQAREAVAGTMHSARERLSRTAEGARRQAGHAREGYDWMLREQPLALGAIGVALGALAAALVPRTRTEDQLMGEQRDELVDAAKEAGREQLEKAKEVGREAASAAKDEARRQDLPAPSAPSSDGVSSATASPPVSVAPVEPSPPPPFTGTPGARGV